MSLTVSLIIPNFNGRLLLEKNLPSILLAKENKANNISEIIIVDDKSSDESVSFLEKEFRGLVKVIKHTKNRGFSSTVNTGARSSKGDLLCLINSDVSVSVNFLQSVLKHFEDELVFGISLHEQGYGPAGAQFKNGFIDFLPGKELDKLTQTLWVSGGSGVFSRKLWMKFGGLDEKLLSPFYWEDIDLSFRAQKRGYKLLWDPRANVVHKHEGTVSKLKKSYVSAIKQRNELLVIWKNITSQRLFRKHIQGLVKRVIRHPGYVRIVLLALTKLSQVIKARKKEKKESTVSDEAIFSRF